MMAGRGAMEIAVPDVDEHPTPQFCALEYLPRPEAGVPRTIKHVILLVVRQADGVLRFLAHPNLHKVVEVTDLSYVMSLFEDFLIRARQHAEELFRQLCSLACGPLLPWKVGNQLSDDPDIQSLVLEFMPL
jgi:hypothetical protein